jgi:hypothetical protein
MIRNKRTAWVFVASVAVNILLTILRGRQFSFGEMLGGTFGLMLVPFLLAYLVKWICQLSKIKFEERTFLIAYAVGWILLTLGNIIAWTTDLVDDYMSLIIKRGQVRKPKKNAKIVKVLAPQSESLDFEETQGQFQIFIPIKEVAYHYVVIDSKYKNLNAPDLVHYSVRLLTHSMNFDYYRIKPEWITENKDGFITSDSLLSTDTFVINEDEIDLKKVFGHINLDLVE